MLTFIDTSDQNLISLGSLLSLLQGLLRQGEQEHEGQAKKAEKAADLGIQVEGKPLETKPSQGTVDEDTGRQHGTGQPPGTGNCGHPTFSEFLEELFSLHSLPISQGTRMQNGEDDAEKATFFGHEFERLRHKCNVKLSEIPGSRHDSHMTV